MANQPFTMRAATAKDAAALAALLRAVWPDEVADEARIAAAVQEPMHQTLVAQRQDTLLGLVDSFETRDGAGQRRWEVDLLAVHPDHRGQGVARHLVAAATEAGRRRGVRLARALVATDNIASQRTFARCGYHTTGADHALYLSSDGAPDTREGADALPVATFRYRGLWVEGALTLDRLHAAQHLRARHALDVVGAVIPLAQPASLDAAHAARFSEAGRYHWWLCEYDEEPKQG